jgi:hypothetical protein
MFDAGKKVEEFLVGERYILYISRVSPCMVHAVEAYGFS